MQEVLPPSDTDTRVTVVGANTATTSEKIVPEVRDQVARQFKLAGELVRQHYPSNTALIGSYVEMAGWVKNRSTSNLLWVSVLEEAIMQTFQHSVVYYMEPEDDPEFENIEIIIDRSFIFNQRHVTFWKEWLRSGLSHRSNRTAGFLVPDTWTKRAHPFQRKYRKDGFFDFSDLFRNHMRFDDSKRVPGLQIADICANICYRYWRGDNQCEPYGLLRPRIVGKSGRELTTVHLTEEDSLIRDEIEKHVSEFDYDSWSREAADRH